MQTARSHEVLRLQIESSEFFRRVDAIVDERIKDEDECFASAKQQSGVDPLAPPPATKTEEQKKAEQQAAADNAKQVKGGSVRGAARGAGGGAAVGAVADSTESTESIALLTFAHIIVSYLPGPGDSPWIAAYTTGLQPVSFVDPGSLYAVRCFGSAG